MQIHYERIYENVNDIVKNITKCKKKANAVAVLNPPLLKRNEIMHFSYDWTIGIYDVVLS